jgi:RimJ/RimL family protein N-acetyltransferase
MHKLLLEIPSRIETERLYLRPYQAADGAMLYAVGQRNRKHLSKFEAGNFLNHFEDEQHAEVIVRELALDWMARKHFFLGIFDRETDQWVGQIYIGPTKWDLPEFTIGYVVDIEHEGRGYITEAVKAALRFIFEHLRAHRVCSDCNDTNVRSYRVLERCGFTREGHFRENKKNPDGSFHGDFQYGLLKREFEAINCK